MIILHSLGDSADGFSSDVFFEPMNLSSPEGKDVLHPTANSTFCFQPALQPTLGSLANRIHPMKRHSFLVLCFLTSLTPIARADLFLNLRFTDNTTSKTVFSGDTVFVDLFLSDPGDDDGLSLEGLTSGGGLIFQASGAASVSSTGAVQGPEFDAPVFQPVPPGGGVIDSALVFSPLFPVPVPAGFGMTSVTVATFQLLVTGNAGDTAILTADVLDPTHVTAGNVTFTNFTDLDALLTDFGTTPGNFGSVSLQIAAVPEPGSLLVAGLLSAGVYWRKRRLKRISDPPATSAS